MSKFLASSRAGQLAIRLGIAAAVLVFQANLITAVAPNFATRPAGRSFADMRSAAEKGDAIAQRLVANAYLTGEGAKQDLAEAVRWLRMAAEQRDPIAQYTMGIFYDQGQGVPRDMVEAVKFFELAARQGLLDAQYDLAVCYRNGDGVPADAKKAFEWFRKAAEQGDARSQCNVGLAYVNGNGVQRDYVEASSWLRRAAYLDDARAQFLLGRLYQLGAGVAAEPDTAVKWFRKAVALGSVEAQFYLGRALCDGDGVAANIPEGMAMIEKAASQNNELAQQYLNPASRDRAPAPGNSVASTRPRTDGAAETSSTLRTTRAVGSEGGALFNSVREPGNTIAPQPKSAPSGNLSTFTNPREPITAPALPTFAAPVQPGATTEKSVGSPVAKVVAPDTRDLPPFNPPLSKDASATNPIRDIFSLPPAGKEAEPGAGFLNDPPRAREPEPSRTREPAATETARAAAETGNANITGLAWLSAIVSLLVLILAAYSVWMFRGRLQSLEAELKKAQFELSKANVNLSAMMHQVEQLSLMAPANSNPAKASLPEWSTEAPKDHTASFKMNRGK